MSEGEEIGEIGRALGATGAAMLSAALVTARIAMQRRAQRAEEALRADQRRQQEIGRELHAERQLAAVQWERVNLRQWFRQSPQEVARVWADAATWAEQDPRAQEAFDSLNLHLDHLGVHDPEIAQAMREAKDYEGLAQLLKQGADEAYGRITGQSPQQQAPAEATAEQVAGWQRLNPVAQFDSPEQAAELWANTAAWKQFDPDAREALESLNVDLRRHRVEVPEVTDVISDIGQAGALSQLLERGAKATAAADPSETAAQAPNADQVRDTAQPDAANPAVAQAEQQPMPPDWDRFREWCEQGPGAREEAAEELRRTRWLEETERVEPAVYAAWQQTAAEAGFPDTAAWFVNNIESAWQVCQTTQLAPASETTPPTHAAAQAGEHTATDTGQRPTGQRHTQAAPTGVYNKAASAAALLAGKAFKTTAEATLNGGQHRRQRPTSHRKARNRKRSTELGRG
jgi:hypothetical protein